MYVVTAASRPPERRPPPLPTLQRLVDGTTGSTTTTILINKLAPDERVPAHVHDVEEILLVTAGRCEVAAGGFVVEVAAGDAVVVPADETHAFRQIGTGRAAVTAILASPDPTFSWL